MHTAGLTDTARDQLWLRRIDGEDSITAFQCADCTVLLADWNYINHNELRTAG